MRLPDDQAAMDVVGHVGLACAFFLGRGTFSASPGDFSLVLSFVESDYPRPLSFADGLNHHAAQLLPLPSSGQWGGERGMDIADHGPIGLFAFCNRAHSSAKRPSSRSNRSRTWRACCFEGGDSAIVQR